MKKFLFIVFIYLIEYVKVVKIYQCGKYSSMNNQCLNQWVDVFGNIKIDLWKCPTNKYCHILPKKYDEGNYIGFCNYNYKKLYDEYSCSMDSQCSSFNCTHSKCVGFSIGEFCRPNYFQCQNNLVCKRNNQILPYGQINNIYKCEVLSKINETCENNNECDMELICGNKGIYDLISLINMTNINNLKDLKEKIDYEKYKSAKNNMKKICFQRASLENGFPTSEAMLCKSGDSMDIEIFPNYKETICISKKEIIKDCDNNNICMIRINLGKLGDIEVSQNCLVSMKGNLYCPLDQKELAWINYLKNYENFYKLNDKNKYHFPVYKDTLNILEVSQSFWSYMDWKNTIEADSCTKEFFFLINKAIKLKYSYYYLFVFYLILFS